MHENFYGWSLENVNKGTVETKYIIEYINDEKIWNRFLRTEDIELYSRREYDDISSALSFYLVWYVNDNCFDIKLWEQVFVNGDMVLEQMIEPESTTKYSLRQSIDREMNERMRQAEQRTEKLEKANVLYHGFIKRMGKQFEDLFNEYVKMEGKT